MYIIVIAYIYIILWNCAYNVCVHIYIYRYTPTHTHIHTIYIYNLKNCIRSF